MRLLLLRALHLKITWGAGGARLGTKNSIPSNLGKEPLKITFVLLTCVYALYLLILLYLYAYAVFVVYVFVFSIRKHCIATDPT